MINNVIQGDLVEMFDQGEFDAIVHGCNCFNRMRSGIAKSITERWPEVSKADEQTKIGCISKLGTVHYVAVERSCGKIGFVINAYTQYNYGNDGKRYVDYCAVKQVFEKINYSYTYRANKRIAIPMIGAGLAGGNWRTIVDAIEYATPDINITIVEFKK